MAETHTHYDVVVIGAGMSGLAAGIRLAHFDKRVLVCDRHYLWGGLNSFYRLKGHRFDVGLHAMTNFVPKGTRHAPLTKLLRQLRIPYDALDLIPQRRSRTQFGDATLHFNNDFELLRAEVARAFPDQIDGFDRLTALVREHDELDLSAAPRMARPVVGEHLTDPLLVDMLFCPLMYYGSADVDDMEFGQFVVMWKAIYFEGFARPQIGVRQLLQLIKGRYRELGGELRMKCGVKALHVDGDRVAELELDDGTRLSADRVISSAGRVETLKLCGLSPEAMPGRPRVGALTFVESISVVDPPPVERGYEETITFFNASADGRFHYRPPDAPLDVRSGVICCPNNFDFPPLADGEDPPLKDQLMRITNIADYRHWTRFGADEAAYQASKQDWYERSLETAVRYSYDFRPDVTFTDIFTPRTIEKFTGHDGGAVYGSPDKVKDGRTHLDNLFLCGTDQGFLGIVGAMLSGITIANLHVLQADVRS